MGVKSNNRNWGEEMDINTLLDQAKRGDEQAFFQLIAHHKYSLYRIAYAYLKNEQDALEAIQEVTFRAFKNLKKLREPKYFSTWLTRILINYCNDELKRKKRFIHNHQHERFEAGKTENNDDRIAVEYAIQKLGPKLQEVVVLKYFHDLTIDQIAHQLNRPEGTIKTWLNKALRDLRKELGNGGELHV